MEFQRMDLSVPRAYVAPQLVHLGDMKALTASGSTGTPEGGGTNCVSGRAASQPCVNV